MSSAARPLPVGAPRLTVGLSLTGHLAPASSAPCTRLASVSRSSSPRNQRDARRRLDPTLPEGAVPSETGLLGPLEVKAISEALGIRPTKVLGQNFVHDAGTVRKIVAAGGVEEGDEVVEVGPGLGSLTLALLEVGARVRAVEIDPPLAAALPAAAKADARTTKIALRRAAARTLPAASAARKKLGFPVPVRDWLRQEPYTSRVRAVFSRPAAAEFFDPRALHSMLNQHLHGGDCWRQIWCVYSFLIWYEQFFGA